MAKLKKTPNLKPVEKPELIKVIKEVEFKYGNYCITIDRLIFSRVYKIYLKHSSRAERTNLDKSFETYEEAEEYMYKYLEELPIA